VAAVPAEPAWSSLMARRGGELAQRISCGARRWSHGWPHGPTPRASQTKLAGNDLLLRFQGARHDSGCCITRLTDYVVSQTIQRWLPEVWLGVNHQPNQIGP
jgi:hypothetical protein